MALTKIKTGGLTDNSVTDAKVADAITVTGAQTGITSVGTLTSFAVSHSSDFGSFTSTLQYPILKLNSTYGSAAGSGYIDFQRDGTTASRIYQTNQELRFATGGTTDAVTIDSSQNATFAGSAKITNGLRTATGTERYLVLREGNELNLYSSSGVGDSNRQTLYINHLGTGSTVDISESELVVVKGTGSTFAGTINSSTSSTTDSVLTLTDAGVADYKFTFPDTGTMKLSTNTSSSKKFFLKNDGSGQFNFETDGEITLSSYLNIDQTAQNGIKIKTDDTAVIWVYDKTSDAITGGVNWGHSDGTTLFYTGGINERMRITSAGSIGVNETNPAAKFDIDGDIQIRNANALLLNHTGGGASDTYINSPSDNVMAFRTGGTERVRITSAGKVGIHTSSPNVGGYNDERGVLTISSTDNGSANNYAILELQGHSIANSVGLGGVSFLDHTAQVALIQGERQNNSQSSKLSFYTSESGPSIQRRMTIYDAGHVEVSKTITAEKNSKFELWMNTGDNGRSAALHHDTLKFSVEKFDVNDDTSHVNNKTRFTAPRDGHYYLSFSGNANVSAGNGAVLYFTFHKNGSANALYYYYGMTGGTAAGWKYITGNAVIALSANDYIEVQSRVSGGTHYWDASGSTHWTSFRGFKLT